MRLSFVLEIVALVSLAFFTAVSSGFAEEKERTVLPAYSLPTKVPALKLAKKATASAAQTAETPPFVEDCETNDTCPADTAEQTSHRRRAEKKKPAPAATEAAGTPIERLQQLCGDEVVLQPIIVRSTLADAMRRVALWGDCCPICGRPPAGNDHKQTETDCPGGPLPRQQVLDVEDSQPAQGPAPAPLRAGEPAQVILDTQKRLGKSVTDGTEFGGSPELLIQWIRILDEENRRRHLAQDEADQVESSEPTELDTSVTARSQVETLRLACRQLQEAADLLEEQNLFEAADSLRSFADVLRRQSRHKLSQSGPLDETPVSQPRQAAR